MYQTRKAGSSSINPLAEDPLLDMVLVRMEFLNFRASILGTIDPMVTDTREGTMDDTMDEAIDMTISQLSPLNGTGPNSKTAKSPKGKGKAPWHHVDWNSHFADAEMTMKPSNDVKTEDAHIANTRTTMTKRRRDPTPPPRTTSLSPQSMDSDDISNYKLPAKRKTQRKASTRKARLGMWKNDEKLSSVIKRTPKRKLGKGTTTPVRPDMNNEEAEDSITMYQRPAPTEEDQDTMEDLSKEWVQLDKARLFSDEEHSSTDSDSDSDWSHTQIMREIKSARGHRKAREGKKVKSERAKVENAKEEKPKEEKAKEDGGRLAKSRRDMGKLPLFHETKTMGTKEVEGVFAEAGFHI
jgi:hypothetical protein